LAKESNVLWVLENMPGDPDSWIRLGNYRGEYLSVTRDRGRYRISIDDATGVEVASGVGEAWAFLRRFLLGTGE